ncbi:MAG: hypothetical protein RIN56_00130 [Sporomusaceae bacterium]|nr:hypothetical protein [Sporomusaceae bacterium]
MAGTDKTTPSGRRDSQYPPLAAVETAKVLALSIEDERRKIGELAFTDLSSLAVIHRIRKLEQLITQYMLITNAKNARRNKPEDAK